MASALITAVLLQAMAVAAGIHPAGRPIALIKLDGLKSVSSQLVRNQIRSQVGDPYDPKTVQGDIVRITHLGRFSEVTASVSPRKDGSVDLIFHLKEQAMLKSVQVVGNKAISDQTLLRKVGLGSGDPADPFLIDRGKQQIIKAYQDKGYFVVDVTVDKKLLDSQGVLIYRVREGPKVHIQAIRFQGNTVFSNDELWSQIKSRTHIFIFRAGDLNRQQLELDAASIRDYYQQRGYLDAQVGRRIDLSPNQQDATVTFLIDEGKQYTVDKIDIQGNTVFTSAQIREVMDLQSGDFYSRHRQDKSRAAIINMYGKLGYIDTNVTINRIFHEHEPKVDLLVTIDEGHASIVGKLSVRGNEKTRKHVVLKQIRGLTPGEPFDREGIKQTENRLGESPLFSSATVTLLGSRKDRVRDVLVDVKERNTGSLSFGAGISSNSGVIGAIDLVQRNFDITDVPNSLGQLFTGRAFRGGGQYFALSLQPGNTTSRYSVDFRDPYVLESDYYLSTSAYYYKRQQLSYLESRMGATLGLGRRFGDVWSAQVSLRGENVGITSIDADAPVDVFAVEGHNLVTGVGLVVTRDTTDSAVFPSQGSRIQLGLEQVGAIGGSFDFTRLNLRLHKFWTVNEDFLGRKTVVSFRGELGYIFQANQAPVFERLYAGGHSTFRGFDYRGVGPRGIRNDTGTLGDQAVGGDFMLLAGVQYEFPIVKDLLRGVVFTDQGTVDNTASLSKWRVSIGTGLRIKLPFFGQAPFAIDFAYPLVKQSGDQTRLISFDLALPFQ